MRPEGAAAFLATAFFLETFLVAFFLLGFLATFEGGGARKVLYVTRYSENGMLFREIW